jgi:hypothetical protein
MSRIVLVAPAGISSAHGVVDQARLLVARLLELGHDPRLVVVRAPRATEPPPADDPEIGSRETTVPVGDLWEVLDDRIDTLWVHWANFGLAEWRHVGSPLGFARKLRAWRLDHPTVRLALSVHEGWEQPSFTQQPIRRIRGWAQRPPLTIALSSADGVAVNCDRWMHRVGRRVGGHVVKLPTPSNFPPPATFLPYAQRSDVVVMGGPEQRVHLLEQLRRSDLWRTVVTDPDARIHNIGSKPRDEAPVHGLPVVNHGFLDAGAVVEVLAACRLGAIDLPDDVVDKSTVAATCRAHGLATLNFSSGRIEQHDTVAATTIDDLVSWVLHV